MTRVENLDDDDYVDGKRGSKLSIIEDLGNGILVGSDVRSDNIYALFNKEGGLCQKYTPTALKRLKNVIEQILRNHHESE